MKNNTETKNIALYIRTASADANAVDMQRTQLNEYVAELNTKEENLSVKEYSDIGFSGSSIDRPGLNELLTYAQTGQLDLIVTTDNIRLSRNLTDVTELVNEFENSGVITDTCHEQKLLIEEGVGVDTEFMETMQKAMTEYKKMRMSQSIKQGIKNSKKNKK